jgi:hypothetical protein
MKYIGYNTDRIINRLLCSEYIYKVTIMIKKV